MFGSLKMSIKVADIDAKRSAYVVWRGFEESIEKARELGYQGIELGLRQYEDVDFIKLSGFLSKYGMQVSSIGTGQVFSDLHLMLCDVDESRRRQAIKVVKELINVAADFSGRINLSRVCGNCPSEALYEHAMAQLVDSISILTDYAETKKVMLLLEPINRYESNMLNTIDQAVELIRWIPTESLGILPDLFHMNIEEADLRKSLIDNRSLIKYLHFADSNRYAPGMGHINYQEVFDVLIEMKYSGWLCMDILPMPTSDKAAQGAIRYLKMFMKKYEAERLSGLAT